VQAHEIKDIPQSTPAFLIDKDKVSQTLHYLRVLKDRSQCKVLFSIKSLPLTAVMKQTLTVVDGFSVSSLFELRLASEVASGGVDLHVTTPGLKVDEFDALARLSTAISFNSLEQYRQFKPLFKENFSPGLRVNPELSFVEDNRYDPCRAFSKLGVPLSQLSEQLPRGIEGLHFHTLFGSHSFQPLQQTMVKIEAQFNASLLSLKWINLGGGYLFNSEKQIAPLIDLVAQLKRQYELDVFIEPGNAVVGAAGFLVATVIDCFLREGKTVAVLDTSVNHNPEVFEYQRKPLLIEEVLTGEDSAILVGCTCLAGDVFGEYRFNKPINVGDRVTFSHVGAYSLIKSNRFNGYNFPDIYTFDDSTVRKIKTYDYGHYREQWLT